MACSPEIRGQLLDLEVRSYSRRVHLERVRLVPAEHQSAPLGSHVHIHVEYADDRLLSGHALDGSCDVELVPRGHDRHTDTRHVGHNTPPGARRVDDDWSADLT